MSDVKNYLSAEHIRTSISTNLNAHYYEAARTGFFSLVVEDIDNIVRADFDWEDEPQPGDKIARAKETLTLNVIKAPVPHFTLKVNEYKRGNDTVKFAGTPEFESGNIIVDDVVGLDTKSVLMAWQALAYNVHTRKGGRMKDYKKKCTLYEYTQDFEMIRKWDLYGCWISNISEGEFDKENDGKRQITAKLEYDRAVMDTSPGRDKKIITDL